MNDEAITIHLDTARGHITRATLPDNQAGNRELCWHLAGISLAAAQKICERQNGKFKNVSTKQPIENNNMKIRSLVMALVLATVSSGFAQVSSFTGLPKDVPWLEFVSKMDKDPAALATHANRIIAGTSSAVIPASTTLTTPIIVDGLTASGSSTNDFSGSTGPFQTSTGANSLGGIVTVGADPDPAVITAASRTNTGYFKVNGKTSGNFKITTADATAFAVTQTVAAQTVGAVTLTLPNFAGVNDVPVYQTLAQTLASKTLTTPVIATGLTASGSASNDFSGSTGTFKTSSGNMTISGAEVRSTDALSGAGAVSVTKCVTKLTTTGSAQALTLADGVDGQVKTIVHDVDGGSAVLTPATKTGFTIITFTNVGESATLVFVTTRGWIILSIVGAVAS